jgi:Domain of unknown function (DU1801)
MYELKTKVNDASVSTFLEGIEPEAKRDDAYHLVHLMQQATGEEPKMWGTSIVGFGHYRYRYDSGHQGDACLVGFSPRKANFSLYLMLALNPEATPTLARLGKHKVGKGCLYINKLADVQEDILLELIQTSYTAMKAQYA